SGVAARPTRRVPKCEQPWGALYPALGSSSNPNPRSKTMKTISGKTTNGGLSVQTSIKAGGLYVINHNARGLKVRAGVKAGGMSANHNGRALKVRAAVKAG